MKPRLFYLYKLYTYIFIDNNIFGVLELKNKVCD